MVDPLFVNASRGLSAGVLEHPLQLHAVLIVLPKVALAHKKLLPTDPGLHLGCET